MESVQDGGLTVILQNPLGYTHFGITETFEDGQFIDMRCVFLIVSLVGMSSASYHVANLRCCRAEVGLLSHNVIVQGSMINLEPGFSGQGGDMYGAQILVHRAGPNPTPIR